METHTSRFRFGKIARIEWYMDWGEARKAVGLEG